MRAVLRWCESGRELISTPTSARPAGPRPGASARDAPHPAKKGLNTLPYNRISRPTQITIRFGISQALLAGPEPSRAAAPGRGPCGWAWAGPAREAWHTRAGRARRRAGAESPVRVPRCAKPRCAWFQPSRSDPAVAHPPGVRPVAWLRRRLGRFQRPEMENGKGSIPGPGPGAGPEPGPAPGPGGGPRPAPGMVRGPVRGPGPGLLREPRPGARPGGWSRARPGHRPGGWSEAQPGEGTLGPSRPQDTPPRKHTP